MSNNHQINPTRSRRIFQDQTGPPKRWSWQTGPGQPVKGNKTLDQLSIKYGIHSTQITERSGVPVGGAGIDRITHYFRFRAGQSTLPNHEREQIEAPLGSFTESVGLIWHPGRLT